MLERHRQKLVGYLALVALGLLGLGLQNPNQAQDAEVESQEGEAPAEEVSAPSASQAEDPDSLKGKIIQLTVGTADLTDGAKLRSMRQLLAKAEEDEAAAIILELNTSSGYSAEGIGGLVDVVSELEVPVFAYAHPSALGAGAILALACDEIYLAPNSVIGGARPFEKFYESDNTRSEVGTRQEISILRAKLRNLSDQKGRPPGLVDAMINEAAEFELKLDSGGVIQAGEGEILTMTAREASGMTASGEPVLAKAVVKSLDEILEAESLDGPKLATNAQTWRNDLNRLRIVEKAKETPKTPETADSEEESEETEKDPPLFGRVDSENYAGKILVVKVGDQDLISTARFRFMERIVEKAREEGASALILDMHTPGGYLFETLDTMMGTLQGLPFPTYTFVNNKAISAGSMIAISTDHIYMKPNSTIGSALPVSGTGEDVGGAMGKKIKAAMVAAVESVALSKGHDPEVCVAFITTDTELVRDGVVICEEGEVLNLNAVEATEVYNGRPLLAKGIVNSVEEIVELEGLEGEILEIVASPLEQFAQWVQVFSVLLIAIGLAGAYAEMNAPGFGVPGFISVIAFTIFFFGNYMAGNLAGYETAVIFVLGLILVAVEILFLGGGTVIVGAAGACLMLGALGFALVDRFEFSDMMEGGENAPSLFSVVKFPVLTLAGGIMTATLLIILLMRYLPGIKLFQGFILQEAIAGGSNPQLLNGEDQGREDGSGKHGLLGAEGSATSDLRPAGLARIHDRTLDVTTDGVFVAKGSKVQVVAVYGDRIEVAKVEVKEEEGSEV